LQGTFRVGHPAWAALLLGRILPGCSLVASCEANATLIAAALGAWPYLCQGPL